MEHASSPGDANGAHESQNMMSYDHIPDKENEEEGEEDAEKTGDMAGPLQEREQDEEKEGEELNCDSHSEVSLFVEGALIDEEKTYVYRVSLN